MNKWQGISIHRVNEIQKFKVTLIVISKIFDFSGSLFVVAW